MSTSGLPKHRAEILTAELDIDLDCGVCLACLSIVAGTIRAGTSHQVRGALSSITPNLWHEGLAEVALAAVRDAVERGVPDANAALSELEARGVAAALGELSSVPSPWNCCGTKRWNGGSPSWPATA